MMTRKDFQAIADVIAEGRTKDNHVITGAGNFSPLDRVTLAIADYCEETYDRFDFDRFTNAAGIWE